jgi:hypothetical protein
VFAIPMKFLAWRKDPTFRTVLIVATVALTVCLAAHPELRLLLPVLDSLGLDLLIILLGSQVLDFARPVLAPVLHGAYKSAIFLLGIAGPYVEGRLVELRAR